MFKSVLIIIFVVIILMIARTVMQRFKQPEKQSKVHHADTVQCLTCKTYIPRSDAVLNGDKAFCSSQHLNDWNQHS